MSTFVMEDSHDVSVKGTWFEQARFGLFIHWGVYSLLGGRNAEWTLFKDRLDRAEYNRLAKQFKGECFDPDALAALARRAGMNYIVLTTRHHDGFCLFDTRTTDFNSVKTAAGRDFVRDYVEACRRAGLRVGLYYSIMSWQHDAIFTGPGADPEGWERMVQETHGQLRELMGNYGKIDLLWYDGAVVPGIQDSGMIARFWRSRELNARVRELQPDILINSRSGLPEDFSTPEQRFTPTEPGRRCEACMTLNKSWGYNIHDREFKSAADILDTLIRCARYDSNLLLNIGPRGDGSIQAECVERLEAAGNWLARHGEAIYGSRRNAYTEAEHVAGATTCQPGVLYVHVADSSLAQITVDNAEPVKSVALLGSGRALTHEPAEGDAIVVSGLKPEDFDLGPAVVAIAHESKLAHPANLLGGGNEPRINAGNAPVLGDDPDRRMPPKALVRLGKALSELLTSPANEEESAAWTVGWKGWQVFAPKGCETMRLTVPVPGSGAYDLALGVIGRDGTKLTCRLDGHEPLSAKTLDNPGCPDTVLLSGLRLAKGEAALELTGTGGFGLYALRLAPVLRPLPTELWQVIGPFPTRFGPQRPISDMTEALLRPLEPESEFVPDKDYEGIDGRKLRWTATDKREGDHTQHGVNFPWRIGTDHAGVALARTVVTSPEKRSATILLGCDWWANVFVNGKRVVSNRDSTAAADDGAQFNGWKPIPAEIELEKGKNIIVVKCHPGSCANWFTFRISDPGDLIVEPNGMAWRGVGDRQTGVADNVVCVPETPKLPLDSFAEKR
ncbi:MAG: alpha-L-fucosidase [Kiritimatiellia bacterium]